MTLIAFQDGKPIFRDGKVGTEQSCCCDDCDCNELCAKRYIEVTVTRNGGTATLSFTFEYNRQDILDPYNPPFDSEYVVSNTALTFFDAALSAYCGRTAGGVGVQGENIESWGDGCFWKVTLDLYGCDNFSPPGFGNNCDKINQKWVAYIPYDRQLLQGVGYEDQTFGCPVLGPVQFECVGPSDRFGDNENTCDEDTTITGEVFDSP